MKPAPSYFLSLGPGIKGIKGILAPTFHLAVLLPGAQSNGLSDHSLTPLKPSHSDLLLLIDGLIAEICHRNRNLAGKGRSDTREITSRAQSM